MIISSSVATVAAVSQNYTSVTAIITVETGRMKTAVSDVCIVQLLSKCNLKFCMIAD